MVGNVCALWPQLLHLLQDCGDLFEIIYKRLPSLFIGKWLLPCSKQQNR